MIKKWIMVEPYPIGTNIELIGSYFDYPLRIDWERGVTGKIVMYEHNGIEFLYLIDLGKHTPNDPIALRSNTFRLIE